MTQIKDGTGSGNVAEVDGQNRLHSVAHNLTARQVALAKGDLYSLNTGIVTLTSDNPSALIYLKNNSERILIIEQTIFSTGPSTGGSGVYRLSNIISPTSGTIITNANGQAFNANQGSSNIFDGLAYTGVEGDTLVGTASDFLGKIPTEDLIRESSIALPRGAQIGLTFTPPTGNTSMEVEIVVVMYYLDEDAI